MWFHIALIQHDPNHYAEYVGKIYKTNYNCFQVLNISDSLKCSHECMLPVYLCTYSSNSSLKLVHAGCTAFNPQHLLSYWMCVYKSPFKIGIPGSAFKCKTKGTLVHEREQHFEHLSQAEPWAGSRAGPPGLSPPGWAPKDICVLKILDND